MTLEERFNKLKDTPSSINEHLETLRQYASQCESVAEFGVDIGQSTTAFLMVQPQLLISLDVVCKPELDELFGLADEIKRPHLAPVDCMVGKTRWLFGLEDSRTTLIPKVDLLLIDSSHCYTHIKAELDRHHAQVRKYILAHDYIAYGEFGEAGPPQVGIMPALEEFLAAHPEWVVKEKLAYNNGLLVMERVRD
jgi:hypothetical protein